MKTFFERILVGFAIGLFSGIINIVIVPSLIGLVFYGDALGGLWVDAYFFAFFGWPVGVSVGIVIGVFIGMTDYTLSVRPFLGRFGRMSTQVSENAYRKVKQIQNTPL